MQPFKLTLKNYRAFEDTAPATIELRPGFTALVGPNNSGKSSLLKFFHEQRSLFEIIGNVDQLRNFAGGGGVAPGVASVDDPEEIGSNANQRPISVQIDFSAPAESQISRLILRQNRTTGGTWSGELFLGPNYVRVTAPQTTGGKIIDHSRKGTHFVDVEPALAVCEALRRALYVGPYRNAISEGAGSYYDLAIGTSFIDQWDRWKTGASRHANTLVQQVTEDIARIFGFRRLEINAARSPTVTLQVIVDGKPFRLRELGAGLAQFIVVFGNVAVRQPTLLLIDEPELNLHPTLQTDFLTSLTAYTAHGVIFATHSLGLARTTAERIYTCHRQNGRAIIRPFEQTPNFAEFAGEMSFSAFKELGHERILLVEGTTEVKAVQQFLRLLGKEHEVVVLPLGGSALIRGGVEAELHELTRLTDKVAVLIDSERANANAKLAKDRQAFVDECQRLGFDVHVTKLRAFENYLPERAIQAVKGPNYRALRSYERLEDAPLGWGKHENWRIARQITKEELLATDVGRFLAGLA